MDILILAKALIMGIVEGLTEFLPISSTGHLILTGEILKFNNESAKVFEIFIQTGAMVAILWEYRERFIRVVRGFFAGGNELRFVVNIGVAFIPAAVLGLAFGKTIKDHLFAPIPVALAFIAGAVAIYITERRTTIVRIGSVDEMTPLDAFKVGIAQCFALIPGTSRSGATIIGGMLFGIGRKAATEFSFFLAVPTLIAAGAYDLLKHRHLLHARDLPVFGIGFVAAAVSAFVCVRWLIRYISTHDFTIFVWYRIAFGLVILATAYSGVVQWSAG